MTRTERFLDFVGKFPSTNGRIMLTLFLIFLTGIAYLSSQLIFPFFDKEPFTPHLEWLGALAGWSVVDLGSFYAKRKTTFFDGRDENQEVSIGRAYTPTETSEELATTDIPPEIDNPFEQQTRRGRGKR